MIDFDEISVGIKIGLWFQSCVVASYEVNDKFITNWRKIIQFWFYQCIFTVNSKVILFIWYTNTFLQWIHHFFFNQFIVWCNLIIEYQCDHFCKDFHQSLQSFIHKENFRKPIKTCSLYVLAILMLSESLHLIKTSYDELSL